MKRHHAAGIALIAAALSAPAAQAKAQKLRFYEVNGPTKFFSPTGKPLHLNPPKTVPKVGDSFDEIDKLYAGTSKAHDKQSTASDHLTCEFEKSMMGQCTLEVAVGGSMLIARSFTVNLKSNDWNVKSIEGSGRFQGMHASLSESDLPDDNANLVFRVS